jgi:hypothetical protein
MREIATLLEQQGAKGISRTHLSAGIGTQIGGTIAEMIRTGQSSQLERLRGTLDPEALLSRHDR